MHLLTSKGHKMLESETFDIIIFVLPVWQEPYISAKPYLIIKTKTFKASVFTCLQAGAFIYLDSTFNPGVYTTPVFIRGWPLFF